MKWSIVTVFLAIVSTMALSQSQQPVKVNVLEYFDKVPPPPASAKEAYDKCGCNIPAHQGECNADSLFKPLTDRLGQIQLDISTSASGPQGDLMKKMQDPEFQKKMETMSDEEKMKIAMEIQASNTAMMTGPMKPEPQAVTQALKEQGKLTEASSKDMENFNATFQIAQQHKAELEAQHKTVEDWGATEIKKLPLIYQGGESGAYADPKAVYAVNIKAYKKHLAIVDEELKRTNKLWAEKKSNSKQLFALYEQCLEKIHYGDDAKNQLTKQNLATGQIYMISALNSLTRDSQAAYDDAAKWYDQYVQFETTKPQ